MLQFFKSPLEAGFKMDQLLSNSSLILLPKHMYVFWHSPSIFYIRLIFFQGHDDAGAYPSHCHTKAGSPYVSVHCRSLNVWMVGGLNSSQDTQPTSGKWCSTLSDWDYYFRVSVFVFATILFIIWWKFTLIQGVMRTLLHIIIIFKTDIAF